MSGRAAMNTVFAFFADRFTPGRSQMLAELEGALAEPFDVAARRESDEVVAQMRAIGIEVADA